MATVKVTRTIDAPMDFVFQTVSDPRRFAQAIDGVTELTFLSQVTKGAGTRFRQTRELNGKAMTMDFEITEHVPNNRVRIHNEGSRYRVGFAVHPRPIGSRHCSHHVHDYPEPSALAQVADAVVCLLIKKSVERDFDAVKASCEASS
jgi:Polyketide cyclase / dehydrase and lipid transport